MDTAELDHEFDRLFTGHHKAIYNYVLRMVRDRSLAEELTQDVFVKVYNSLSGFRAESEIATWMFKIATNVCLDHFRSRSYKKSEQTDLITSEELIKSSPPGDITRMPSAEDELISAEMSSCVRSYIDDLPEDYRAVILLHDQQGFTNPEIAKITGITIDNVKIRLHRARLKMKTVLSSKCSMYRDERDVLRCVQKEDADSGDDA
jgi:RNA polymerase sigma-70 factor (ECF subfamily)